MQKSVNPNAEQATRIEGVTETDLSNKGNYVQM